MFLNKVDMIWNNILTEARLLADSEPMLTNFLNMTVLKYNNFRDSLVCVLSLKLSKLNILQVDLINILKDVYQTNYNIIVSAAWDVYSIRFKDPSVNNYITPFLYLKGFHALQVYRVAHCLWMRNRLELAMCFYDYVATFFNVDIHPAAKIGYGVMLDHATGVVIGETAIVENNVSIMQAVTLGSTGKDDSSGGSRHPTIKSGVLIGAGAVVLGNIEIGCGSKIGAGSIVLHPVPPYSTVAGNPARLV